MPYTVPYLLLPLWNFSITKLAIATGNCQTSVKIVCFCFCQCFWRFLYNGKIFSFPVVFLNFLLRRSGGERSSCVYNIRTGIYFCNIFIGFSLSHLRNDFTCLRIQLLSIISRKLQIWLKFSWNIWQSEGYFKNFHLADVNQSHSHHISHYVLKVCNRKCIKMISKSY